MPSEQQKIQSTAKAAADDASAKAQQTSDAAAAKAKELRAKAKDAAGKADAEGHRLADEFNKAAQDWEDKCVQYLPTRFPMRAPSLARIPSLCPSRAPAPALPCSCC